jgi:hypothetical protein
LCETKSFWLGHDVCFRTKAALARAHSKTLRVHPKQPKDRQVLECVRASAAFPLAPTVLTRNLDTNLTLFSSDVKDSKNFVLHPILLDIQAGEDEDDGDEESKRKIEYRPSPSVGHILRLSMKTRFLTISIWLVAIGVGLVVFIGAFARFDPASSSHPATVPSANPPPLTQDDPPAEAAAQPPLPANLSSGLSDIIKLAQARVDESVMLAYVKSSGRVFSPTADEILYLSDLGLSQDVIGAIVKSAAPAATPQPPPQIAAAPAPATPPAPPIAQAEPPPAALQPEAEANTGLFLNNLAPYGSWMQHPDYGLVWQPTVETINADWSPYVDGGQWLYSDSGWYWQSDYTWGWAAYHYGRWVNLPRQGWVWTPGNIWAPAWVAWRASSSYIGWAPLPPGVSLNVLGQLTHNSKPVGPNPTFGLPASAYTFVSASNLTSRNLPRRAVPAPRVKALMQSSVVLDSYALVNNRIFNGGASPEAVAAARRRPVPQFALRAISYPEDAGPDMARKTLAVYIPAVLSAAAAPAGPSAADPLRAQAASEKSPVRESAMFVENDSAATAAAPVASKDDAVSVKLPPLHYTASSAAPGVPRQRGDLLVGASPDSRPANRDWPRGYGATAVEHPAASAPRLQIESHPAPVEPPHAALTAPAPAAVPASSSSSSSKSGK